jgi:CubicO group peptidase (beta-lactamase class C family)
MSIDLTTPEIQAAIALVEAQLERELRTRKIPGLSAGIVYEQALIWQHGYGYSNLEKQILADERTVYRVASITKLFTSTMMMLLRDGGKVNLDDPVEKYLPEFKIKSSFADARPPTFRQIASHAAGLPREGEQQGWRDGDMPTIETLIASLAKSEMRLPTMTEPKYSNLGIAILGYALSKIAGQPYDTFVKERILQPLGMIDSGFERDQYQDDHFAVGYYADGETMKPAMVWQEHGFRPAGGMYSTVADISKFISLQFSNAPAGGSQVLGSSSLREMHMPVNVTQDFASGFGLGFGIQRVANQKVIGHSGGLPGYTTNISLAPQLKLAMIVFTNTGTDPVTLSHKMLEVLIPAFKNQEVEPTYTAEQITSWQPYIGRYTWMTMDDVLEIRVLHGKLTALTVGEAPSTFVTLTPNGEHTFKMSGGSSNYEEMRFEVDGSGKVTGLWMGGYPFRRIGDGV